MASLDNVEKDRRVFAFMEGMVATLDLVALSIYHFLLISRALVVHSMECVVAGRDEPLSPIGKMLLQKDLCGVINCLIGLEKPIEPEAARLEFENSPWIKHPRFCSVLVRDKNGKEHWRKTQVDLEKHFIILEDRVGEGEDDEAIVNQYMADLAVSSPLSTDKPLWEFHFLMADKCVAIRIHHALETGSL
ncbi:hypothetical protein RJ641_019286 [Dillenia turbinata]|uniref:Diacylglycerol O-acyltransferase n=1 Tax=Dillenia turbinata TaxID=194707 RepID=A0AAN8YY14_9MAGN